MGKYKPIVLTVTFCHRKGGDIAKFQLTIPELPKEDQLIRINGVIYKVHNSGAIDYSEEKVTIILK